MENENYRTATDTWPWPFNTHVIAFVFRRVATGPAPLYLLSADNGPVASPRSADDATAYMDAGCRLPLGANSWYGTWFKSEFGNFSRLYSGMLWTSDNYILQALYIGPKHVSKLRFVSKESGILTYLN
jgi:hypothetical protein